MDHNHGGPDDMEMLCPMQMSFHGGSCEIILFPSWATTEVAAFVGATIGFFLLAFAYEGLKYGRELLHATGVVKPGAPNPAKRTLREALLSRAHVVQTVLHLLQVTVSYILMLIVMTYNYYLCLAVVLGAMCGYYVFGWVRNSAVDPTEHCN
ncbi:high affinity copper uptake protein 1 [Anopheles ziemanni]|uniref:high affinity copper uptake protein 1 n=1 Tax=Anopheles coustani TaxID=139045 RepID=UPI002658E4F4|nr:high affinity copper uptake protein 1 [Anopheles coustani]XP_058176464.1 high affinity copper uptake protein 1 [Anopheles ziemanni]